MSLNSATETVSVSAPWSSAGSIGDGYRLAVSRHSSQLTVSGTQNVVTETSFGWLLAVSATVHRTLLLLLTLLSTTDSLLVRCLRGLWMESGALFLATTHRAHREARPPSRVTAPSFSER